RDHVRELDRRSEQAVRERLALDSPAEPRQLLFEPRLHRAVTGSSRHPWTERDLALDTSVRTRTVDREPRGAARDEEETQTECDPERTSGDHQNVNCAWIATRTFRRTICFCRSRFCPNPRSTLPVTLSLNPYDPPALIDKRSSFTSNCGACVSPFRVWIVSPERSEYAPDRRHVMLLLIVVSLPRNTTFWPCVYERLRLAFTSVLRSVTIELTVVSSGRDSRSVTRRSMRNSARVPLLKSPVKPSNGCH